MWTAYCYMSGEIGFCPKGKMPKGTLPIASHEEVSLLRDAVETVAVHGWNDDLLIVGGLRTILHCIEEGKTVPPTCESDPVKALEQFNAEVAKRLN